MIRRTVLDESHEEFRKLARGFAERELMPHLDRWEEEGIVDRSLYEKAGDVGLLGIAAPVEFGGGGETDFRYSAVRIEEFARASVLTAGLGIGMQTDLAMPDFVKFTNDEQKHRWLPGLCGGQLVSALTMTEPNTGPDPAAISTRAVRDGDHLPSTAPKSSFPTGSWPTSSSSCAALGTAFRADSTVAGHDTGFHRRSPRTRLCANRYRI